MSELIVDRRRLEVADVEPWSEAVDGKVLLDELVNEISNYVVLPNFGAQALSLFVVHTYAFELRDITTYIAVESPEKRCGKTTLLTVLSELVNRPVVSSNISPPAFFRVIEEFGPTLLIDEAETFLRGNDELRGILNAGYTRRTAYVVRVATSEKLQNPNAKLQDGATSTSDGRNGSALARFSSWCPKVIAAIGKLPDTLGDRCIVIRMHRKTDKEECRRLRDLEPGALRRKCARFVQDNRAEISSAKPQIPKALNDRAADIWEPLLAIADIAGEEWAQKAREAAEALTYAAQEQNPTGSLLLDIMLVFAGTGSDRMLSRHLAQRLNDFRERPWQVLCRGRAANEAWLAHHLRPYGVLTRTVRVGEERAKGYYLEDFSDVFKRYVPRKELLELVEDGAKDSPPHCNWI